MDEVDWMTTDGVTQRWLPVPNVLNEPSQQNYRIFIYINEVNSQFWCCCHYSSVYDMYGWHLTVAMATAFPKRDFLIDLQIFAQLVLMKYKLPPVCGYQNTAHTMHLPYAYMYIGSIYLGKPHPRLVRTVVGICVRESV